MCVCMWPCRAVTVLNTLCKGQQVAMTSQGCQPSLPTTSYCPSWVRMSQSDRELKLHLFAFTNCSKQLHVPWDFTYSQLSVLQGGVSTTWARWTWHATSPRASWWPSNKPTWMSAPRRSCCSSWWAEMEMYLKVTLCSCSDSYFYFGCLRRKHLHALMFSTHTVHCCSTMFFTLLLNGPC